MKKSISICNDVDCYNLDDTKWLSARSREMIAVKLINGNPLKYTYKIDTQNLSLFNEPTAAAQQIIAETKAKADADNAKRNIVESQDSDKDEESIKEIINYNHQLIHEVDNLSIDVESLYKILKLKNTLVKDDYYDRDQFISDAKDQLKKSYDLLNALELLKDNSQYANVKEIVVLTKVKAEKNVESIISKFYNIDLNVYTLPIDVQGKNIDAVEFKLHRFDKETKEEDLSFASKPYNVWIKGGFKIDVSAGLFFTSLYDSELSTKDDPAIAGNKIITLKNGGDYDLAFGSTINTYVRMNSWIVPTLNFGAVITQNEKLQVLLGVGAILGKQERIIFSTGFSMGKVTRIADSYSVGGSYNLGNSGDVPTQNQFKFGHFFWNYLQLNQS
ncbi:hypothetical protein AAFH68_27380 [Flavobacterium sp. CGRL1]